MKLYVKAALFTLVAPGSVGVWVPAFLARNRETVEGAVQVPAVLLMAIGGLIYLRCVWDFVAFGKGTPAPIDAPKRLVIRGLYRYSRNPMYVGLLTMIAGWALLYGSVLLAAYGVGIFIFFSLFIHFHEEPRLSREFGDEYEAYRTQVGRWLPRPPRRRHA